MHRERLIMACCSDIAGLARGKAFPGREFEPRLKSGVGWCPTNVQITAFDRIAETPFGPVGDVLLMPDAETRVDVDFGPEDPGEHFVLCDITETDGTPWDCCLRTLLRGALAALERESGLALVASFEHEFHYSNGDPRPGGAYGLRSFRKGALLGEMLVSALDQAGITTELFHPEYGAAQYEVSVSAQTALTAADQAVVLRELTRAVAARLGGAVSFAPVVPGMGVGNGVHVHLALVDQDGAPAMHDPNGVGGLSARAGSFVAGILRHLPALVAFTAASVASYQRLVPHTWSASFTNLAARDREAAVRICPVREGDDVATQFHVEYRAADAAASPYLVLAMLVYAGLQGLREGLATPRPSTGDLAAMAADELATRGVRRLPLSLKAALEELAADEVVRSWLPSRLLDVYVKHKRGEMAALAGLNDADQAARYVAVY